MTSHSFKNLPGLSFTPFLAPILVKGSYLYYNLKLELRLYLDKDLRGVKGIYSKW